MNQALRSNEWEIRFNQEALDVEELLISGDMQLLSQSKIRIALENKILSWDSYKNWLQSEFHFPVMKKNISPLELSELKMKIQENKKIFKHHQIWNEDILPLEVWDNHIIVLGLSPIDAVMSLPNVIFVLCSIDIMNQLASAYQFNTCTDQEYNSGSSEEEKSFSKSSTDLLSLDLNPAKSIDLNFASISNQLVSEKNLETTETNANLEQTKTKTSSTEIIEKDSKSMKKNSSHWNKIAEQHLLSSEQARKIFDGYVVLKLTNGKTKLFNMDEDLRKENINESLFEYDLGIDNPFKQVYTTGQTESFGINQLHLTILDFKYACVTPLRLGSQIRGFLVGFKVTQLNSEDEKTLEQLAIYNAA